jgi:hypothetical protein
MKSFQFGDKIEYLRPRKERGPDGWYDRIPGIYITQCRWGRSLRYKINIEVDGELKGRYVHPLSIHAAPSSSTQEKPDSAGDQHG